MAPRQWLHVADILQPERQKDAKEKTDKLPLNEPLGPPRRQLKQPADSTRINLASPAAPGATVAPPIPQTPSD